MQGSRQQIARLQSDFYRDQFHKLLNWLFVSTVIVFVLIATILYFIFFQPTRHYYGNTVNGNILNMPRPVH